MKLNNKQLGLLGGFVLAIGLTIYFWRKNQVAVSDKSDADEGLNQPDANALKSKENASVNTGDFLEKKKNLQILLGFEGKDVDGIIGDKTKQRLQERGLTTNVTASNVSSLIAQLNAKTTDVDKTKARLSRANLLAPKASTAKMYTWIDAPSNLPIYEKDALGGFLKTNNLLNVNKTDKFKIPIQGQTILSSGFIRARISDKDGRERYIIVSPYSVTVF